MLTVELPATVKSGQRFEANLHQLERGQRVVGSVQISIPVTKADAILTDESRTLSVMKYIATTIPPGNRWYEVFQRYVLHLARRVDALGGDSKGIHPNPDGARLIERKIWGALEPLLDPGRETSEGRSR